MSSAGLLYPSPSSARIVASAHTGSFFAGLDYPTPKQPIGIPFPQTYDLFVDYRTPLIFGILYFIIAKTASHYSDGKNRMKGKFFDTVIVGHNLILAVYSAWTFISTAPYLFSAFYQGYLHGGFGGLLHVFCDTDFALWKAASSTFPFFCYTFYLSKFYEVLDTVIILLKGKKVGLLQSYHHTGAILTMWAGYRSEAMAIWIFVVFNSFIHTLMYCYYAFTALKLPFPQILKKNLTKLQITQFLVGGSLAASYLFIQLPSIQLPSIPYYNFASLPRGAADAREQIVEFVRHGGQCTADTAQRAAVWLNVLYLVPLTYLFAAFFVKSYQKAQARKVKDAAANAAHEKEVQEHEKEEDNRPVARSTRSGKVGNKAE